MSVAMPEDSNNRLRPVGRSPRLTGTIEGQGFRSTFSEAVENQVPWGWCRLRGDFRGTFDGDSLMPRALSTGPPDGPDPPRDGAQLR